MTSPKSPCSTCSRFYRETITCEAFPKAIPDEIYFGDNDHRKPFPGDNGLTYDLIESEAQTNADSKDPNLIADMFNEERVGGTYQRTVKSIDKAIEDLGDEIMRALDAKR